MNEKKDIYELDELRKIGPVLLKLAIFVEEEKRKERDMYKRAIELEERIVDLLSRMEERGVFFGEIEDLLLSIFEVMEKEAEKAGFKVEDFIPWSEETWRTIPVIRRAKILRILTRLSEEYENGEVPEKTLIERVKQELGVREHVIEKDLRVLETGAWIKEIWKPVIGISGVVFYKRGDSLPISLRHIARVLSERAEDLAELSSKVKRIEPEEQEELKEEGIASEGFLTPIRREILGLVEKNPIQREELVGELMKKFNIGEEEAEKEIRIMIEVGLLEDNGAIRTTDWWNEMKKYEEMVIFEEEKENEVPYGSFQSSSYRRSQIMRILAEMEKQYENGDVPRAELIAQAAKELNMIGKEVIIEKDIKSLYESGRIYIPRPSYVKRVPRREGL